METLKRNPLLLPLQEYMTAKILIKGPKFIENQIWRAIILETLFWQPNTILLGETLETANSIHEIKGHHSSLPFDTNIVEET